MEASTRKKIVLYGGIAVVLGIIACFAFCNG